MAPPELVTEFSALKPQLLFPLGSYADVEKTWINPIEIIRQAAIALTEDAAIFRAIGYHEIHTAASEEFLRSLVYYAKVLVQDSLVAIETEFKAFSRLNLSKER
ncbi:hypothetical protein V8C37DRAFT_380412 [Trichoderma ceciliae]